MEFNICDFVNAYLKQKLWNKYLIETEPAVNLLQKDMMNISMKRTIVILIAVFAFGSIAVFGGRYSAEKNNKSIKSPAANLAFHQDSDMGLQPKVRAPEL